MDFVEATDRLTECPSLRALAEKLGAAHGSIRQARLDPASPSYRRPPAGWQEAVADMAEERARELQRLAGKLREAGEGLEP